MTSSISGDSQILGPGGPIPVEEVARPNTDRGFDIVAPPDTGLNIAITGDGSDKVQGENQSAPDFISTGGGNDYIHGGGDDDFLDGGDGQDIIRGGTGDDVIKGGKGADVLFGGEGADVFLIQGDPIDGAFGADSDLQFASRSSDPNGQLLIDSIIDFNDHEDVLVLQDLQVDGIGAVEYDPHSGDVTLTDSADPDVHRVIAKLQPGLDITVVDQGDGNWTLL